LKRYNAVIVISVVAAMSMCSTNLLAAAEIGVGVGLSLSMPHPRESFNKMTPQFPVPVASWVDFHPDRWFCIRGEFAFTQKTCQSSLEKTVVGNQPGQITRTGETLTYGSQMNYISFSPLLKISRKSLTFRFYAIAGPEIDILYLLRVAQFDQGYTWYFNNIPENFRRVVAGIRAGFGMDRAVGKWRAGISADIQNDVTPALRGNTADTYTATIGLRLNIARSN
jgi:hypothetical protein